MLPETSNEVDVKRKVVKTEKKAYVVVKLTTLKRENVISFRYLRKKKTI